MGKNNQRNPFVEHKDKKKLYKDKKQWVASSIATLAIGVAALSGTTVTGSADVAEDNGNQNSNPGVAEKGTTTVATAKSVTTTPTESTTQQAAETPAQPTTQQAAETPAQSTTQQAAETPAQPTTQQAAETPAQPTTQQVAETPAQPTTQQVAETPAQPVGQQSVEKTVSQPAADQITNNAASQKELTKEFPEDVQKPTNNGDNVNVSSDEMQEKTDTHSNSDLVDERNSENAKRDDEKAKLEQEQDAQNIEVKNDQVRAEAKNTVEKVKDNSDLNKVKTKPAREATEDMSRISKELLDQANKVQHLADQRANISATDNVVHDEAISALRDHIQTQNATVQANVRAIDMSIRDNDLKGAQKLMILTGSMVQNMSNELGQAYKIAEEDKNGVDKAAYAKAVKAYPHVPKVSGVSTILTQQGNLVAYAQSAADYDAFLDAVLHAGISDQFKNIVDPTTWTGGTANQTIGDVDYTVSMTGSRSYPGGSKISVKTSDMQATQQKANDILVDGSLGWKSNTSVSGNGTRVAGDGLLMAPGQTATLHNIGRTRSGKNINARVTATRPSSESNPKNWYIGHSIANINNGSKTDKLIIASTSALNYKVSFFDDAGNAVPLVYDIGFGDIDAALGLVRQTVGINATRDSSGAQIAVVGDKLTVDSDGNYTYNGDNADNTDDDLNGYSVVALQVGSEFNFYMGGTGGSHVDLTPEDVTEKSVKTMYIETLFGQTSAPQVDISIPQKAKINFVDVDNGNKIVPYQGKTSIDEMGFEGDRGTFNFGTPSGYEVRQGTSATLNGQALSVNGMTFNRQPMEGYPNYNLSSSNGSITWDFDNVVDDGLISQDMVIYLIHAREAISGTSNGVVKYVVKDATGKVTTAVKAPTSVTQTIQWNGSKDQITGLVTYNPQSQLGSVTSPVLKGYTPDLKVAQFNQLKTMQGSANTTDPKNQNQEIIVTYTPNSQNLVIRYINDDTQQQVGATQTVSGHTDQSGTYNISFDKSKYKLNTDNGSPIDLIAGTGKLVNNANTSVNWTLDDTDDQGTIPSQQIIVHLHSLNDVSEYKSEYKTDYKYSNTDNPKSGTTAAPSKIQTITWKKIVDKATGQVQLVPDVSNFDSVVSSPEIKGYTPSDNSASFTMPATQYFKPGVSDADIAKTISSLTQHKTITYTADRQSATIHVIDVNGSYVSGKKSGFTSADGTEMTAYQTHYNGVTEQTQTGNVASTIKQLQDAGYKVISTDTGVSVDGTIHFIYDNDGSKFQNINIYVGHQTRPAEYGDDDTPANVDKDGKVHVDRTIKYVYGSKTTKAGQEAAKPVTQSYDMVGVTDKVTHKTTWSPVSGTLPEVVSPVIKGYAPDKPKVSAFKGNQLSNPGDVVVTYMAEDQTAIFHYHDEDKNNPKQIPNQVEKGSSSESATTTLKIPEGYKVDEAKLPSGLKYDAKTKTVHYTYDNDSSVDQNYDIYLEHDYRNAKDGDNGVPDGVKVDKDGNVTVTRTIHYIKQNDQTKLFEDSIQKAVMHGEYDPVLKQTKWTVLSDKSVGITIPLGTPTAKSGEAAADLFKNGVDKLGHVIIDEVASPEVKGHPASQSQVSQWAVDVTSTDRVEYVYYSDYVNGVYVHYIDDVTGKEISQKLQSFNGLPDEKFTNKNLNWDFTKENYKISKVTADSANGKTIDNVVTNGGMNITFTVPTSTSANYYIHLSHATRPAQDGDDGVPSGVKPDKDGVVTTTRTIHLVEGGKEIVKPIAQTATFKGTYDLVTGKTTWAPEKGQWPGYTPLAINGYTPDKTSVASKEVVPSTPSEDVYINYKANQQKAKIVYVDDTTGKSLDANTQAISGKSDSQLAATLWDYKGNGYKLADKQSDEIRNQLSTDGKTLHVEFDRDDDVDQTFTIHLTHAYRTVDDNDVDLPNGHKLDNNGDLVVKRTINYVTEEEGSTKKISTSDIQQIAYRGIIDPVTKEVRWSVDVANTTLNKAKISSPTLSNADIESQWAESVSEDKLNDLFNEVATPKVDGYFSNDATVSDTEVYFAKPDSVVNVKYIKDPANKDDIADETKKSVGYTIQDVLVDSTGKQIEILKTTSANGRIGTTIQNQPGTYAGYKLVKSTSNQMTLTKDGQNSIVNTYVRIDSLASIKTKDVSIYTGENWSPEDDFVSAKDVDGYEVGFDKVTVEGADKVDTSKAGKYEVTYKIGNKTAKAVVTVKENQTSVAAKDTTIYTGDAWTAADAFVSATDKDGHKVDLKDVTVEGADKVDTSKAGKYEVTYKVGNKTAKAVVTVKENQTSISAKDVIILTGSHWTAADNFVSATDKDGHKVDLKDVTVVGADKVDSNTPGKYTVIYKNGDKSISVIVDVRNDATSVTAKDTTIYTGDAWTAADDFVSATDKDGHKVDLKDVTVEGADKVDTSKAGKYEVTYKVGNKTAKAVVTVKENQTSVAAKDTTIYTGDAWTAADAFVSATDKDGHKVDLKDVTVEGSDKVDTSKAGEYEVTYKVGNKTAKAVVTVKENQTSVAAKDTTIYTGDAWTTADAFVSATDKDGHKVDLKDVTVEGSDKVDTSKAGKYEVTYKIGNKTAKAVLTVKEDQTSISAKDVTIYVGDKWSASDNFESATDKNGNVVPFEDVEVEGAENVSTNKAGEFAVTYKTGDKSVTVKVNVVEDETSLVTKNSSINQGENWSPSDNFVSATDAEGKSIDIEDVTVIGGDKVDTNTPGKYTVIYQFGGKKNTTIVEVKPVSDKNEDKDTSKTVHDVIVDKDGNVTGNLGDQIVSSDDQDGQTAKAHDGYKQVGVRDNDDGSVTREFQKIVGDQATGTSHSTDTKSQESPVKEVMGSEPVRKQELQEADTNSGRNLAEQSVLPDTGSVESNVATAMGVGLLGLTTGLGAMKKRRKVRAGNRESEELVGK